MWSILLVSRNSRHKFLLFKCCFQATITERTHLDGAWAAHKTLTAHRKQQERSDRPWTEQRFHLREDWRCVRCGLACLGVSSLVGDLVDGVQQALLVAVRVQFELGAGVVTELGDGHLSDSTGTRLIEQQQQKRVKLQSDKIVHFYNLQMFFFNFFFFQRFKISFIRQQHGKFLIREQTTHI